MRFNMGHLNAHDYIFNNAKSSFLCGVTDGNSLNPYVVLPTTNGEARRFGYWVQPARACGTGFIQPVQLAF